MLKFGLNDLRLVAAREGYTLLESLQGAAAGAGGPAARIAPWRDGPTLHAAIVQFLDGDGGSDV